MASLKRSATSSSTMESPDRRSRVPVKTAWRTASVHSTQASVQRGSGCVSADTARAASAAASASSRVANATTAVRMRLPFAADERGCEAVNDRALRARSSGPSAPASTDAVWFPMSSGPSSNHSRNFSPIASRALGVWRSAPSAATSAMAIAISVSSVHSPAGRPVRLPGSMVTVSGSHGPLNS